MGACIIRGRCNEGFTPEECRDSAGRYVDRCGGDGGTGGTGGGGCLMMSAMPSAAGEAIATIGLTYNDQVRFREIVLQPTPIGKKFVKLYYAHKLKMISIGARDLQLLGDMYSAWIRILNFVTAITTLAEGGKVPNDLRRLAFTQGQYDRCVAVMGRMRANCDCADFGSALDAVQKELALYVGLSPEKALETLRRDESKRKKK